MHVCSYAIDLLGFGRSSRVCTRLSHFQALLRTVVPVVRHTAQESLILLTRATACQAIAPGSSAADAQQWWVQSLEAWRVAMGLLRFELCGASFTRNVMHMH